MLNTEIKSLTDEILTPGEVKEIVQGVYWLRMPLPFQLDHINVWLIDDYDGWNTTSNNDNISSGSHGTAVSGMIGAKGNNNQGGAGVNWDVGIMQVQMGGLSESNVIAAYNYPYVMRNLFNNSGGTQGAFVVATNASWGIDLANPSNYPVWCAYYDDLGSVGILNCGATANTEYNIDTQGDMPTGCGSDYMVSVTATNSNDVRTFSAYGATTIDLAAPGESVYLPSGSSSYSSTSGTSFATPCVAGAIALVYSVPCSDLASSAISNPEVLKFLDNSSAILNVTRKNVNFNIELYHPSEGETGVHLSPIPYFIPVHENSELSVFRGFFYFILVNILTFAILINIIGINKIIYNLVTFSFGCSQIF